LLLLTERKEDGVGRNVTRLLRNAIRNLFQTRRRKLLSLKGRDMMKTLRKQKRGILFSATGGGGKRMRGRGERFRGGKAEPSRSWKRNFFSP